MAILYLRQSFTPGTQACYPKKSRCLKKLFLLLKGGCETPEKPAKHTSYSEVVMSRHRVLSYDLYVRLPLEQIIQRCLLFIYYRDLCLEFTLFGVGQCAGKSGTYLAGESPVVEGVPAPPHSESCVAGGNKSDEA